MFSFLLMGDAKLIIRVDCWPLCANCILQDTSMNDSKIDDGALLKNQQAASNKVYDMLFLSTRKKHGSKETDVFES